MRRGRRKSTLTMTQRGESYDGDNDHDNSNVTIRYRDGPKSSSSLSLGTETTASVSDTTTTTDHEYGSALDSDLNLNGSAIPLHHSLQQQPQPPPQHDNHNPCQAALFHPMDNPQLLKPMPTFNNNMELRHLASQIQNDILQISPNTPFSSIVALEEPKRLLKESLILPSRYPPLFTVGFRSGVPPPPRKKSLRSPPLSNGTISNGTTSFIPSKMSRH